MPIIEKQTGTMEYLQAEGISVPHGFTTRKGGVSEGAFDSLNLAFGRGDREENVAENYRIMAKTLGFSLESLVLTRQTHSDIIRTVTKRDHLGLNHRHYPECDALITREPGTVLGVFTADCTPILLHDPITGAVGAIHAGWRGTAADIAGKTVRAMAGEFGCQPENIRAAIGPNIAQCCFETDSEVPQAMMAALGQLAKPHILPRNGKYFVDLKAINAEFLKRAGVRCIEISHICTMCQHQKFWSHRATGGIRGAQGAFILCQEVTP